MAQQIINTGTAPNDGTGDTLKTSFTKANANFSELYTRPLGNAYTTSPTAPSSPNAGDFWYDTTTGVLASYVNDGSSSQWVEVSPSAGNLGSAEAFIKVRPFTSTTTYTPSAGTQFVVVECVGGGGGGGGTNVAGAGTYYTGGGGGSGGFSRSYLTAAQIGSSQAVTIGGGGAGGVGASSTHGSSGGDTSLGSLCVARGGGGGRSCLNTGAIIGAGGAGGVAGIGDVVAAGAPGGNGMLTSGVSAVTSGGEGGSSIFGGGATPVYVQGGAVVGGNGQNYGSGGGGGASIGVAASCDGGVGSPGIIIVTEYNIGPGKQGPQGLAGGVTTPLTPQGRLTLQAATPVMTTTQSAKTTIYYTPYCGNQIPIFNGASWATQSFNELSAITTDTTKSPAAIGVSKVNDWFVWDDAGTLRLCHGIDWPDDTGGRFGGGGIQRLNGIWVNSAAITNGPAAARGTYVGTTRSNGSSQLDWIFGGLATNGTAGVFGLWNAYNRVNVASFTGDNTGSWVVSVVSTWRVANGSSTMRCSMVRGLDEDAVVGQYTCTFVSGASNNAAIGVGLDTTTSFNGNTGAGLVTGSAAISATATYVGLPGLGFHFLQATEFNAGGGGGSTTFVSGTVFQNGLNVSFRA